MKRLRKESEEWKKSPCKEEYSKEEYIVGKKRDNLFLTQTPQAFNLKEIEI